VSWAGVDDGGADADSSGVSGDSGSGRFAACSRTASCRSDAGAVPAENSGGDDAAAARGGSDWLPARTNSSTSDGRAFSRGRNPTCIQGTPRPGIRIRVTVRRHSYTTE